MAPTNQEDDRFRREFVTESDSILEKAAETLAELETESDPHPEILNALFRSIHSLKGLAGMVGLPGVTETAHDLEALLDRVRMGRVPLDSLTIQAARAGLSTLEELAKRLSKGDPNPLPPEGVFHLLREASLDRDGGTSKKRERPLTIPPELERVLTDYERHRLAENVKKDRQILLLPLDLALDGFDEGLRNGMAAAGKAGELIGTFPGPVSSPESMNFILLVSASAEIPSEEIALLCGALSFQRLDVPEPPAESPISEKAPGEPAPEERRSATQGTVRVGLEKIGHLLDLSGDLALSRNVLKRGLDRLLASPFDRAARMEVQKSYAHLDRAVTALGRAALATRLVPVEQMTARLIRAARSISESLGKEVAFEVLGRETEIDKILADELVDPLLHLLRNALDHGIESPEARRAAGKNVEGSITLTAAARGREVVFTMTDDGKGIDPAAILARARQTGVLSASEPDPPDPLEPIFHPGFSMSERVSELSGRGVGLDVVRSNIHALKGTVTVRSVSGVGTKFEVVVPITLALVESLLVRIGGRSFAFPTSSIVRTFRAESYRIRAENGVESVIDDGESIRLVSLESLLGIGGEAAGSRRTVVVAEQGSRRVGFVVNEIEGMEDLVVKPLSDDVPRAAAITGTAELPDGEVALTLDTGLLLERAALSFGSAGLP